jgi:Phage tail assembly chaperone protein, TAC
MTEIFATQARQLAGLCGAVLGWRPAEFWAATPSELAAIIAALTPSIEAADGALIKRMKEQFPDG